MSKKIRVGIIFGGKSAEHEVSLQSAKNVVEAIDRNTYEVVLIGVDKNGRWLLPDQSQFLLNEADPLLIALNKAHSTDVVLVPECAGELTALSVQQATQTVDVVFPILHGPFGEDGTVQGLLKLAGVPFVGCGVLGAAVGMDKDVMKRLLRDAGIPIGNYIALQSHEVRPTFEMVTKELGMPVFIKPANMGSSVGVSKVTNEKEYTAALDEAFLYDTKVLIEAYIMGKEVECAVLGNDAPIASCLGEVVSAHDFYSYEAKYIDENGAVLRVPAEVPEALVSTVQSLAVKTFKTLCCEGLGRVDFFVQDDGNIFVNEINTMPGFTSISMYPRLWGASGIGYTELITRLIDLAFERFEKEKKLKTAR